MIPGANPALGAYYTEPELAGAVVDAILARVPDALDGLVIEPSVGGGAFLGAILARAPATARVWAVDVDPAASGLRHPDPRVRGVHADFLRWLPPAPGTVIGNPPFSILVPKLRPSKAPVLDREGAPVTVRRSVVAEHIRAALAASSRHAFLLFRLGVLASAERDGLTTGAGGLRAAWVLRPRPAFHGATSSDNSEYAIYWWDKRIPRTWVPRLEHLRWRADKGGRK